MTSPFLTPADLDANPWAACGQTSIAAVLRRHLGDVFPVCPDHRWMNARQMRYALARLGASIKDTPFVHENSLELERTWPTRGVALVQFVGPWSEGPRATKRAHWIGVSTPPGGAEPMVFDVNVLFAGINHGWVPRSFWEKRIVPVLVKGHRKATGAWWIREGIEVTP